MIYYNKEYGLAEDKSRPELRNFLETRGAFKGEELRTPHRPRVFESPKPKSYFAAEVARRESYGNGDTHSI